MKLAGSLGMRREEICGLKWENVDLQRHLVLIREARTAYGATIVQKETKNRASVRTLYLPDEVYLLLEQEQARQQQERCVQSPAYNPTDHVILDAKGAPYSPNALSLAFTRFVRKNDLPRLTFHGLRHPYVKHTTKKYNSEKQKTQATKMDLIAWGFCFCIVSYSKRSWTL